jgi:hypothetical protein
LKLPFNGVSGGFKVMHFHLMEGIGSSPISKTPFLARRGTNSSGENSIGFPKAPNSEILFEWCSSQFSCEFQVSVSGVQNVFHTRSGTTLTGEHNAFPIELDVEIRFD